MSKDPAVLFYTSDFLTGTMTMSDDHVGKYIRLLCLQHQKGVLSKEDMMFICKAYVKDVFDKFVEKGGQYYNIRLREEAEKRQLYSESRSHNRSNYNKNKKLEKYHMKNICKSYVQHMENENEDVNRDDSIVVKRSSKSIPPTFEEVTLYCKERGKGINPRDFYNHYEANGWIRGKTKIKDWQACVRTWEGKTPMGIAPKAPVKLMEHPKPIDPVERDAVAKLISATTRGIK